MNDNKDTAWAEDVSFTSLEKKIKESKKATMFALRPLDEKLAAKTGKSKSEPVRSSEKSQTNSKQSKSKDNEIVSKAALKRSRKRFIISLGAWSGALIFIIAILLFNFYRFLEDYEKVYIL